MGICCQIRTWNLSGPLRWILWKNLPSYRIPIAEGTRGGELSRSRPRGYLCGQGNVQRLKADIKTLLEFLVKAFLLEISHCLRPRHDYPRVYPHFSDDVPEQRKQLAGSWCWPKHSWHMPCLSTKTPPSVCIPLTLHLGLKTKPS